MDYPCTENLHSAVSDYISHFNADRQWNHSGEATGKLCAVSLGTMKNRLRPLLSTIRCPFVHHITYSLQSVWTAPITCVCTTTSMFCAMNVRALCAILTVCFKKSSDFPPARFAIHTATMKRWQYTAISGAPRLRYHPRIFFL